MSKKEDINKEELSAEETGKKEDKGSNKTLIIVIAAVVVAVIAAAGIGIGVSKSKSKAEETTTETATQTTTAGPISAYYGADDINLYDDTVWDDIKKNPDRWGNLFTSVYGMSDEEKASCLDGPENGEWVCYQLFVTIDNSKNENAISYTGINIEGNGENGVYVQQSISAEFQNLEKGGLNQIVLNVFVHNSDFSMGEVLGYIDLMNIQLVCGPEITEVPDDDSPLIPENETVYVDVVAEA